MGEAFTIGGRPESNRHKSAHSTVRMPQSYTIHEDLDLIVMRYHGHVTLDDLRSAFLSSVSDPRYRAGMMELGDFSAATATEIGFTEVMAFADKVRMAYEQLPGKVLVAHYAPSEVAYGMARMYQTIMSDVEQLELGLFTTVPEALDHLGLSRDGIATRIGLAPPNGSATPAQTETGAGANSLSENGESVKGDA